jgi:hypothetical protein
VWGQTVHSLGLGALLCIWGFCGGMKHEFFITPKFHPGHSSRFDALFAEFKEINQTHVLSKNHFQPGPPQGEMSGPAFDNFVSKADRLGDASAADRASRRPCTRPRVSTGEPIAGSFTTWITTVVILELIHAPKLHRMSADQMDLLLSCEYLHSTPARVLRRFFISRALVPHVWGIMGYIMWVLRVHLRRLCREGRRGYRLRVLQQLH